MKIIALFSEYQNPIEKMALKADHFLAWEELAEEIARQGGQLVVTGHQESYQNEGRFARSWRFEQGQWLDNGPVKADVIFNKGSLQDDGKVPIFNDQFVSQLCTDKWVTFKMFPDLFPHTVLIQHAEELEAKIAELSGDNIVLKPEEGKEGVGIYIGPKAELPKSELTYPLIGQEFLDSSGGVPGIVEGLHDFRVAILNGEIIYCYYRTPPQGSFLANVARGGKFAMVPVEKIPEAALAVVQRVEAVMKQHPKRFYGVDMAFTPQGVKIIELNSSLGLLPNKDGHEFKTLKEKLATTLLSL